MIFNGKSHSFVDPSDQSGFPVFNPFGYPTKNDAMMALDTFFRDIATDDNGKVKNMKVEPQYIVLELNGWSSANFGNITFS